MNYELAKELKDAGYPQDKGDYLCKCGEPTLVTNGQFGRCTCGSIYYNPTLSELIDACGEGEMTLQRIGVKWDAMLFRGSNSYSSGDDTYGTPEDAVARLWLSLHNTTNGETNTNKEAE